MSAVASDKTKRNVFMGHCITLFAAAGFIIPLDLVGIDIRGTAFSAMVWFSVLTCGYALMNNYGSPDIKACWAAKSMMPLQPFMAKVTPSPDFLGLFFSMIYVSVGNSGLVSLAVSLIIGRRALWSTCTMASVLYKENSIWKRVEPFWTGRLKANSEKILQQISFLEIGLGFLLIVRLAFPSRMLMCLFLHWQWLRMRYMTEIMKGTGRHVTTWAQLKLLTDPYIHKVPMLPKVVDYVKNWFASGMVQVQQQ